MKRVLFLAVVLAILFSFSACGPSPQEATPTPAPTPAPSQAPPPTPVPLPAPPTPPPSPEPEPTPEEIAQKYDLIIDGSTISIETANGTWRELLAEAALKKLLDEYDVSKWIFTREILIEEGGIPHSRPILTITPRNLYLYDELVFFSTFLHEQICWFLYPDRNYEVNRAIGELRQLYPEVPVGGTEGGIDENSTYRHLIANFLEFSAMVELVGEELAVATMERKDHYTWTYETVLSDAVKIEEIAKKYGLIIE